MPDTWRNKDEMFRELTERRLKFLEEKIMKMEIEISRIGDKIYNRR